MKRIVSAIKLVFVQWQYLLFSSAVSIITLALYFFVVETTASVRDFLTSVTWWISLLQVIGIVFSSILVGISFGFLAFTIRQYRNQNAVDIGQTLLALFFSVASTGCAVCGTVLLPTIGISVGISGLALGGLEIKVITIALLLYSLYLLAGNVLGICPLDLEHKISIRAGSAQLFQLKKKYWYTFLHLSISLLGVALIYTLPLVYKGFGVTTTVVATDNFVCSEHQ